MPRTREQMKTFKMNMQQNTDSPPPQGRRKQCEAAGGTISKGHLLLSHHFSGQQYLLKLYCMDTRLLLAIMDRKLRNDDRFLAIRYTVLKAQNKISKQTYIA
jgi:hypothetical protein